MREFLETQFKEDVSLLQKPREVVFIGNGRAGKSSLINRILDFESCRVSKHGGCTEYFNLYDISSNKAQIVDSPSYGNFKSSSKCKNRYKKMIKNYLTFSTRLCKIFFVLDSTKPLREEDQVMFNFMKNLKLPIQLVLNKVELLPADLVYSKILSFTHPFKIFDDIVDSKVLLTSAQTKFGIESLKKAVKQALMEAP